jgi:hypothetical protein
MAGPVTRRDLPTARDSARIFRRTALAVLDGAQAETGDGRQQASAESLGSVVCAATNLAFALELYLKAAHIKAGTGFDRKIHDLSQIYLRLPDTERSDIEARYDTLLSKVPDELIQFVDLARGPTSPPPWPDSIRLRDGLAPMLSRSSDVFTSWRYVFEIELSDESKHQMTRFEHSLMNVACEALEGYLSDP